MAKAKTKPSAAPRDIASGIDVWCRHDALLDVTELVENPRNPNKHGDKQIALLAKIIKTQGWRAPITVSNRSGFIVKGHGRLHAARLLQVENVPVERQDYATEAEEYADLIADNRIAELADLDDGMLSGLLKDAMFTDFDMDLTGFDASSLLELASIAGAGDPVDAEPKMGEADILRTKYGVELGQLWAMGENTIFCGDSTKAEDVKLALNGAVPMLMVTDPPYGVEYDPAWRIKATDGSSARTGKVLNDNRASWAAAYMHFPGDVAYVWHAGMYGGEVERSLSACNFELKSQIIWVKKNFVLSRSHYHWRHEPCFFAVKKGGKAWFVGNRKNNTVWADIVDSWKPSDELFVQKIDQDTLLAFDSSLTTIWDLGVSGEVKTVHGTQKPLECMARPIRNHESEFVYEPFSGSGTTIMACHNAGRKCRAIELSPGYVAVALQRYADATGVEPTRIR